MSNHTVQGDVHPQHLLNTKGFQSQPQTRKQTSLGSAERPKPATRLLSFMWNWHGTWKRGFLWGTGVTLAKGSLFSVFLISTA